MTPSARVLRVVNVFPQVQVTVVSTYVGWMSAFMVLLLGIGGRRVVGSCRREPVPEVSSVPERRTWGATLSAGWVFRRQETLTWRYSDWPLRTPPSAVVPCSHRVTRT